MIKPKLNQNLRDVKALGFPTTASCFTLTKVYALNIQEGMGLELTQINFYL